MSGLPLRKILSNKQVNRDAFISVIPNIWKFVEDFEIEVVSRNTFSFTFKNVNDQHQVLLGGPWSFDKALLVLEAPVGNGDVQNMTFNKMAFWVQIHNVPLFCMTVDIGKFLGGHDQRDEQLRRMLRVDLMRYGKETTMLLRCDGGGGGKKYSRNFERIVRSGIGAEIMGKVAIRWKGKDLVYDFV
ncbi:hypothetical protein Dsin_015987 [Dipteronia sinensis]|uniref:DUF4283 domain-containing protein n=1 Tax=Dipteronia sinensis TaxID=43782 RepID=A0AAE0E526_9ROSI|nr:hypothetical protein Dsin_015987 [Dipteronia sinensis]